MIISLVPGGVFFWSGFLVVMTIAWTRYLKALLEGVFDDDDTLIDMILMMYKYPQWKAEFEQLVGTKLIAADRQETDWTHYKFFSSLPLRIYSAYQRGWLQARKPKT